MCVRVRERKREMKIKNMKDSIQIFYARYCLKIARKVDGEREHVCVRVRERKREM